MPDLLTPPEVAKILRCTPRQIRYMLTDGRLKGVRTGGRTLLVHRESIDEFLKRSEIHANS